jgi:hypothetical protein
MWAECKTSAAMPKASCADRAKITQGRLKDSLKKPLVEGNLASQLTGL